MIPFRAGVLLGVFAAIALVVVCLRVEQTRGAARTLALESKWIELRRELWRVQGEVARLRAPGRLYDRMAWFETDLVPPASGEVAGRVTRIAYYRPIE